MIENIFSFIRKNKLTIPQIVISFLIVLFIIVFLICNIFTNGNNHQMLDSESSYTISNVEENNNKESLKGESETSLKNEKEEVKETSNQESNVNESFDDKISSNKEEVKEETSSQEQLIVNDEPLNNNKGDGSIDENTCNERTPLRTVISKDVRIASNLTAEELEKGLYYKLKPLANIFIKAEKEYGINAIILASIAAEESGWGRYCYKPYNLFGFYTKKDFTSYEECILYVAKYLNQKYLTEGACYFNGYSLKDVNKSYNGRQVWYDHISNIAYGIESRVY